MQKIVCENCLDCAISDKCDAADKVVANSCITDHSVLLEIYEQGKADGRKEIVDKVIGVIKELESIKGGYQDLALGTEMPQSRDYIKQMETIGVAIYLIKAHFEIEEEQLKEQKE